MLYVLIYACTDMYLYIMYTGLQAQQASWYLCGTRTRPVYYYFCPIGSCVGLLNTPYTTILRVSICLIAIYCHVTFHARG